MMKTFSQSIAALTAAIGISLSTPAAAEPILLDGNSIGDDFVISFDGFVDGGPALDGLSGQLELTLSSIMNGVYNFNYALTNTGETNDNVSSRISSFAFNTDPEIVGAESTGTFSFTNLDRNFPNGIGRVDVCFLGSGTNSCAGGGSGGVFDGETGAGTLSLDFGGAIAALTLDDFFVRYQSIDGIDGITSASGREITSSSSGGGTDVPAPGMFLILAMALLALFLPHQRKVATRKQSDPFTPEFA